MVAFPVRLSSSYEASVTFSVITYDRLSRSFYVSGVPGSFYDQWSFVSDPFLRV